MVGTRNAGKQLGPHPGIAAHWEPSSHSESRNRAPVLRFRPMNPFNEVCDDVCNGTCLAKLTIRTKPQLIICIRQNNKLE
jgi:hypothetical protein